MDDIFFRLGEETRGFEDKKSVLSYFQNDLPKKRSIGLNSHLHDEKIKTDCIFYFSWHDRIVAKAKFTGEIFEDESETNYKRYRVEDITIINSDTKVNMNIIGHQVSTLFYIDSDEKKAEIKRAIS